MSYLISDARASIFRFCSDFAAEMQAADVTPGMTLYNFDAHAEEKDLPAGDLIGGYGLSYDLDFKLLTVRGMIAISTDNDPNLFRLEDIGARLFQRLSPDNIIPLLDAVTGAAAGALKVAEGTSLSPVANARQRPLKLLAITLKSDRAVP